MTTLIAAVDPAGGAAIGEVIGATAGAMVATTLLFALGFGHRSGRTQLLERWSGFAARVAGLPTWVALPSAIGTGSLIVALLGMYWDISLHIDQGRDPGPLANPAHYLILVRPVRDLRRRLPADGDPEGEAVPDRRSGSTRDWEVPLGALLMTAAGGFALIGFPLDDMWHRLFGQDVTLWGPTHLMLIGGASISLIGQAILLAEGDALARRGGRRARRAAAARVARRRLPDRPLDLPGRVRLRRAAVRLPLPADADRARGRHRARLRAPVGRARRRRSAPSRSSSSCAASCR